MVLFFLACQHNQKSEVPISSCTQDDEQNISFAEGDWNLFALPNSTHLLFVYPHPRGLLFSAHTTEPFEQREQNTSHLIWWSNHCNGLNQFENLTGCSSTDISQNCLLDSQPQMFAHSLFFPQDSNHLDEIQFSDTKFDFSETPPHTVQIKNFASKRFYQSRNMIYDSSASPILPYMEQRYIFDMYPSKDDIFLLQLQPTKEIQKWNISSSSSQCIEISSIIHPSQWSLYQDNWMFYIENSSIHVSSVDTFPIHEQISLPTTPLQICSNSQIWILFEDSLSNLEWDESNSSLIELHRYQIHIPSSNYELFCSQGYIYLADVFHSSLYRMTIP